MSNTSTTSTMASLPNECIQNILQYVKENDYKTFHSTALISRQWCQNSIEFLWKQPFNIPDSFKYRYKLISIFLYFFHVNQNDSFHTYSIIAPSFNYLDFLKNLHSDNLAKIVLEWVTKHYSAPKKRYRRRNQKKSFTSYRNKISLLKRIFKSNLTSSSFDLKPFQEKFTLIIQSILNVIVEKCTNIEYLHIGKGYSEYSFVENYLEDYLLKHDTSKCFIKLSTFHCHQPNIDPTIFLRFSNYMRNITSLSVTISNNNIFDDSKLKELVRLIDSQNHLLSLSIRNEYNADMSLLFEAISRKSDSLQKLELISHRNLKHDEANYLSHCVNLKELSIYGIKICEELDPLLINSKFLNLKDLRFMKTYQQPSNEVSPFISMITNNGALLKYLHLDIDLRINSDLLKTISKICLNLTTFFISIHEGEMFSLLYPIFENCKKLKTINIYKVRTDGLTENNLSDLVNNISINLSSLILNDIKFSPKYIDKDTLLIKLKKSFLLLH